MADTDYNFRLTRNQIIESAFSKIGVLAPGEILPGEQLVQGAQALDLIVKELQNEHIFLWTEEKNTLELTQDVEYVSLPDDPPLEIIRDGYWKKHETDDDYKLTQVSEEAFYREQSIYFNSNRTGDPEYFYVDLKQNKVFFCPIPSEHAYFKYVGVVRAKDWDVSSDRGEFPARWQKALIYLLAADLSDDYRIPQQEKQLLAQSAAIYVQRAKSGDRDGNDSLVMGGGFNVQRKTSGYFTKWSKW